MCSWTPRSGVCQLRTYRSSLDSLRSVKWTKTSSVADTEGFSARISELRLRGGGGGGERAEAVVRRRPGGLLGPDFGAEAPRGRRGGRGAHEEREDERNEETIDSILPGHPTSSSSKEEKTFFWTGAPGGGK